MAEQDIALMAHLMRRAGFGATYEELERRVSAGYEATVDELLNPESQPDLDMDILERHFIDWRDMNALEVNQAYWTYRMINTQRPLQEKVALFWHGILCTGNSKCEHGRQVQLQLDMFRDSGMKTFPEILRGLARDPAMKQATQKTTLRRQLGRSLDGQLLIQSLDILMAGMNQTLSTILMIMMKRKKHSSVKQVILTAMK